MPSKVSTSLVMGVGVAAALTALAADRGHHAPAQVAGAPLVAGSAVPIAQASPAAPRADQKARSAGPLVGDAALGALLDLDHIERVADHYEAPLRDGRRAILTLDPIVQEAAERMLSRARAPSGAVVVTATDGRILAVAGRRTEDPKGGADGIADWRLAVDTWAPAASIFKIVTASALVEAGVGPDTRVCYHGGIRSVMESNLADARNDGRCEDLSFGVAHSQNAIIAKLAHRHLDPKRLAATAQKLGVDGPLPDFALHGEGGQCEVPADKGLEFAKMAAGFSGTRLSVVGGALLANAIASGGFSVTPRLVAEVVDGDRRSVIAAGPKKRVLAADVARKVASMMVETCDSGSAAKAFPRSGRLGKGQVAGKTGTLSRSQPFYMQYSWFVGFAPADQPSVSIAVLLGNAELWQIKAHQAARMVLEAAVDTDTRAVDRM